MEISRYQGGNSGADSFEWVLKAYAEGSPFTAFDLETTGLAPARDRIVEIGALKFDRRGIIARFSTLVNPGIPMPPDAEKVNGISSEMLEGKPSLDEALPDFLAFIKGAVLVAHNAPFDCGFVNENLSRLYGEGKSPFAALPNPLVDTLAFSRTVFPGRRSYSLQNLAADLGISACNAHRAEDDARLCAEILKMALCAFSA